MRLVLTRHLWGLAERWEDLFPRIRASGYEAIETPVPPPADRARFRALLDEHGFDYVAMIFTAGATVADHVASFREQATAAQELRPLLITSHSGRDAWDASAATAFFGQLLGVETALDVPVAHETHRGRVLYNPWITSRLLDEFEALQLCCDLSHWVCVGERLLDGELAIVEQAAQRCLHLHARVGYEQGPQVPDPRAPEYQRHVEAHERWWRLIWEAQAERGRAVSTLTPEYGPPGYLHTLPYTDVPVADLWAICDWQARRAAELFREVAAAAPRPTS